MPSRKKPQKETGWNVLRMRGSGTVSLGLIYAVDETDALKKAVERFAIRPELKAGLSSVRGTRERPMQTCLDDN
jgi:hypothetical protein